MPLLLCALQWCDVAQVLGNTVEGAWVSVTGLGAPGREAVMQAEPLPQLGMALAESWPTAPAHVATPPIVSDVEDQNVSQLQPGPHVPRHAALSRKGTSKGQVEDGSDQPLSASLSPTAHRLA